MNEEERQRRFREADENNTAKRAEILGVPYRDMRPDEATLPLVEDAISVDEMYKFRIVPLSGGGRSDLTIYGITLSTPESQIR